MANEQKINEIIDEKAFQQLDLLEDKLMMNKKAFVDAAKSAKEYNSAIGSAQSLKEYSILVDVAVKANTRLGDSSEKIRLAEIRLEMARRKAFDDFEKRLTQQQNAQDRQAAKAARDAEKAIRDQQRQVQSDIALRNARIANIEAYNRRLAQQEAAQQRATIAQIRAAEAARAANMPYNRMSTELGVLRTRARDIGVEFGLNSRQFREAAASVQVLDQRLRAINAALGQRQGNASDLAGIRGQISGMASQYLSFYAVVAGVGSVIRSNSQISDSLADVQRTAGLTANEADNLADQLKKIDTRTSLKGLLAVSTIGGQLGIAKDQLAGFTQVVDQLSIVLSNEIPGGAEAVATSLGKINGVFKVQQQEGTNTEDSLRKTGSAILALGQAGLATGEYLQDFTLRTAGTAQVAKISLPTILAYSAVLEETGSSAEVAGTAFNKLVGSLASKREQFFAIAKIGDAKLTLKEFTDLINNDADAALQKFFIGLNRGGSSLTTFTDLLDTLKIKSGPGKNAIIALSQNQELLAKRVEQSNKAYADGTLVADQFAIKNENLAASIGKLGNAITNITTSPNSNIGNWFKGFINSLSGGIKAVDIMIGKLKQLQYDSAIERFDKKGETGNIFISTDNVKEEKARRDMERQASRRAELQKIGLRMAKDIILDNKYTGKSVESLIEQETKLGALRAEYTAENRKGNNRSVAEISRILTALEKQKSLVAELKRAYGTPAIKPIDISSTLGGGGKKGKTNNPETDAILSEKRIAEGKRQALKTIIDDEKGHYQNRLNALVLFEGAAIETARLEGEKQLQNTKLTEKGRESVYQDTENKIQKIKQESSEKKIKIIEEGLSKDQKATLKANQKEIDEIKAQEAVKMSLLKSQYANGLISKEEFEKRQLDIQNEYSLKVISIQISQAKKLIEKLSLTNEQRAEALKNLRDLEIKYDDQVNDNKIKKAEVSATKQDEIDKKVLESKKEKFEQQKELISEVFNFGQSLLSASFTNELNAIQGEIDANEKKKDKDIENVNNSVGTEEEKANKIAIINARAQSQQDMLEQKQRDVKTRQAKADKAAAIAQAIINGALAMTKVAAQTGILSFAFSPIIAAITAAQIAAIIAQPIPKFEHGGIMRENGLAMYGEVGQELMIDPSGKLSLTPGTPTIGHVKAGTEFISNKDLVKMIAKPDLVSPTTGMTIDIQSLISEQKNSTKELKNAIGKMKVSTSNITRFGWFKTQSEMKNTNDYINNNFG